MNISEVGNIFEFSTAAAGWAKCLIVYRQSNAGFPNLGLRAYLSREKLHGERECH